MIGPNKKADRGGMRTFDFSMSSLFRTTAQTFQNWLFIISRFAEPRLRRGDEVPTRLIFRKSHGATECRTRAGLYASILAAHLATRIPGVDSEDILTVGKLADYVDLSLRRTFDSQELSRASPGGGPGPYSVSLYCLVRSLRPTWVVETGVAQGSSSLFVLSALQANGFGELISIDKPNYNPIGYRYESEPDRSDPVYLKKSLEPGWLVPANLRARWSVLLADSRRGLPQITHEVGLFAHDSEHSYENMMFEYNWAWNHLGWGGFLVSDDVAWNDSFRDFTGTHATDGKVYSSKGIGVVQKTVRAHATT